MSLLLKKNTELDMEMVKSILEMVMEMDMDMEKNINRILTKKNLIR